MNELTPRHYINPAPVRRRTRKELERREQAVILRRDALEAAAEEAQREIEVQDQLAFGRALLRIKGAHDMTDYAKHRTAQGLRVTELESRGDRYREHILRSYDENAAIVDQIIVNNYGTTR